MAIIYKIVNKINNKIYIGKTERSLKKRFQEHCSEAFQQRSYNKPLYRAMRKYGIDNFEIILVENTNNPIEREKYWIQFYNSYKEGYNATLGGEGINTYDHEKILEALKLNPRPKQIADQFNCCVDIVRDIAKNANIKTISSGQELFLKKSKEIEQYSLEGNFIQKFISIAEAERWLFENKIISKRYSSIRGHISEVAKGKRKTAYGYKWKYPEN